MAFPTAVESRFAKTITITADPAYEVHEPTPKGASYSAPLPRHQPTQRPTRPSYKQQEAVLPVTVATAGGLGLPPSRAAPCCRRPERPHTPQMHADATVRGPHEHPSPQRHKGMEQRNSVGPPVALTPLTSKLKNVVCAHSPTGFATADHDSQGRW
jgi:hypothetical protein